MVEHLNDSEALQSAKALRPKSYLAYIDCVSPQITTMSPVLKPCPRFCVLGPFTSLSRGALVRVLRPPACPVAPSDRR